MSVLKGLGRFAAFAVPVAIGAGVFAAGMFMRKAPEQAPPAEEARVVRVITLKQQEFVPRVSGFGPVQPARTWNAIAQVSGRIAYVHPALEQGAILPAGTEILRISPQDYQLAVREAEANVKSARAKLAELEVSRENARQSRELERRSLELIRKDLERKQELVRRGTVSQSSLDETERALISQQSRVQDIENTIRLSPAQIEAQKRQIEVSEAKLQTAKLNLERTRIKLPFNARIAKVNVERTQFVATGTTLAIADDISVAEVDAQIPLARFRDFVMVATPQDFKLPGVSAGQDAVRRVIAGLNWTARLKLRFEDQEVTWDGTVVRTTDTIDASTRSVGVVVQVAGPYRNAQPGRRPPLVKGTFVNVEISGPPLKDRIVLPRSAVHAGKVYLVDDDNRLRIRDVTVRVRQGNVALIGNGLKSGMRVVVSDIAPAIDGMLLQPVPDDTGPAKAAENKAQGGPSQ